MLWGYVGFGACGLVFLVVRGIIPKNGDSNGEEDEHDMETGII